MKLYSSGPRELPSGRGTVAAACLLLGVAAGPLAAQNLPPNHPGFNPPLVISDQGNVEFSHPVIAELGTLAGGTANTKEIVFGTKQGDLHVIHRRASDGVWVPAFTPVFIGGPVNSSPAVGDVNGDGAPDIVVGYGTNNDLSQPGGLKAFNRTGTLLWSVVTQDVIGNNGAPNGQPDPVYSSPAIGDVDGDGKMEVAFGSFDFNIYLVKGENGTAEAGWPRFIRDTVWSSPALHDIDGDGRLDIIIGVDAHLEGPPFNTPDGGCLHVFRFDGAEVSGFPKCVEQVVVSSPSVGDIDGDGQPEIVHGTGGFWPSRPKRVYAWNCDGTPVAGWPVTVQGNSSFSPALANLDGDAALEVVVTDESNRLYRFEGNGAQTFAVQPKDFFGATLGISHPVIADVLGDSALEILVATNGSVAVFNSTTGALLTDDGTHPPGAFAFMTDATLSGVAVADLESDNQKIEVLAVSATPFNTTANTEIHVWNPVNRSSTPPWGFFRQSADRRGVAPGTTPCGGLPACTLSTTATDFFTVTPCRVLDTRSSGPALAAGVPRTLTVGGTCGVPANARAVSVNVTVTGPGNLGHVRFGPGGCALPATSSINFGAGQTRANNAILPLAPDGSGRLLAEAAVLGGGSVHLILDVNGYFQ